MNDDQNSSDGKGSHVLEADIVPIARGRKTEAAKKTKIQAIKQAFEEYFPLNKPKKNVKKTKKNKRKK